MKPNQWEKVSMRLQTADEAAGEEGRGVLSMDQLCSALGNWGMQMTAFTVPREHLGTGNSAGRLSHSLPLDWFG